MSLTGLCTAGPAGPLLWLRDGTALIIDTPDDLSEYQNLVVFVEGQRLGTSILLEAITPSHENAGTFFNTDG